MTYLQRRSNFVVVRPIGIALVIALLITSMPGAVQALNIFSPRQKLSSLSLAYGRLASDYSLAVKRYGIQATGPVTPAIVFGQVTNYVDAYLSASENVSTNSSIMEYYYNGINAVAAALPSSSWLSCPYPCTNTDAAIIELRTITSNINQLNGFGYTTFSRTWNRPAVGKNSPLGTAVSVQYGQAGYVIGSALVFCALMFIVPLSTAVIASIAVGAAIGIASYIFAEITNAQENEFISNISDASDGTFAVNLLPPLVQGLPPQFQQSALSWVESAVGVSRTIAKGIVPAIAPITSIWALLVAAQVTQNKARAGHYINPPLYPSNGVNANAPVLTGYYTCVSFNGGTTTCWLHNIGL